MMEQHPIPQQISSYEFKLVGDMTLKQFLKAAAGLLLALMINSSKLIVIIKWPLMFLFAGGGLMLAFVPFEERPLEAWIVAFIKAIYSPTVYIYKRKKINNWLDLDLKEKKEEKGVEDSRVKSNLVGNKLKEAISIIGAKEIKNEEGLKVEEKIEKKEEVLKAEIIEEKKEEIVKKEEKVEKKEENWRDNKANLNLKGEKLEATGKAVFGSIPMPDIPEIPNVIVGMATSMEGKIIDGVIIEIQDEHGNPSRVLKSNALGQFKTTTPLADGRYLIIAEKDGFNFDRVNVDLNNQIVQPIRIISNN
jgi:hypothetical protein